MDTNNTKSILESLIEINNDRVAGFEKAIADIKSENIDLKEVFQQYSAQSRKFSQELTAVLARFGGEAQTGNSFAGTLHRAWIDVKSIFGGSDRASILSEAERGEDAIKKAYQTALEDGSLSGESLELVSRQSGEIKAAHDSIKALRDAAKVTA